MKAPTSVQADQVDDQPSSAPVVIALLTVMVLTTVVGLVVAAVTGWAGVRAGWTFASLTFALPAIAAGLLFGSRLRRLSAVICVLYVAGVAVPLGWWVHTGSSPSPGQLGARVDDVRLPPDFLLKEERRDWSYFALEMFGRIGWQPASVARVYYTHLEPRRAVDELTTSFRRVGWLVDVPSDAIGEVPAASKRYRARPATADHWADALKDGTQVHMRAQLRSAGALRTFDPSYRYSVEIAVSPIDWPSAVPTPSEFR